MRLFYYGKDGGKESTVWGFWLCEFKRLFSVVLLRFEPGSREAYHSHAFNSTSWVLKGKLVEYHLFEPRIEVYTPSLRPVTTHRWTFHRVVSVGRTWVLSFRGPWSKQWNEFVPDSDGLITLTHGRKVV